MIDPDELEYFIDLAMNESQRWLETVTRERFVDEDDFLYSIRYGTQLRKLLNKIRPGSFSIGDGNECDASCSDQNSDREEDNLHVVETKLKFTLEHDDHDDETWIPSFLRICRTVLGIRPQRLFRPTDLDATIDSSSREGHLSNEVLDRVRRVVVAVGELAQLYETTLERSLNIAVALRIDKSALERIVQYHDYLWLIGQENDHCLLAYSSPRIKRTSSTRDSASARRKATAITSQISTTSAGERDNDEEESNYRSPKEDCQPLSDTTNATSEHVECEIGEEINDIAYSASEYSMTMRPSSSPVPCSTVYQFERNRNHHSYVVAAELSGGTNSMAQESENSDVGLTDYSNERQMDSYHGLPENDIEDVPAPDQSISSKEPSYEQSSEYSFEYSRSTSPDQTGANGFDCSSISLASEATVVSAPWATFDCAKYDSCSKSERRTVRSAKHGASSSQPKLFRRPSTGIIEPAATSNPLKYVQTKSDLDLRARKLIDKAKESKQRRAAQMRIEEQEQEWAADLENWRLRRSSSLASVQRSKSEPDGAIEDRCSYERPNSVNQAKGSVTIESPIEDDKCFMSMTYQRRQSFEPISPLQATVSAISASEHPEKSTDEMNGAGEHLGQSTMTSRLPIVANGKDVGNGSLLSTSVVPLENGGIHSSTSSSTTPAQRHLSKSTLDEKTALIRSNNAAANGEGVKKGVTSSMQENGDSTTTTSEGNLDAKERFKAAKSFYDSTSITMDQGNFRSRPSYKQIETNRIAPVYAKIPSDEAAIDSGVDSYRPESLTPSHESLSPGSQGSGEHNRKSSSEQVDFGLKSSLNFPNNFRSGAQFWSSYESKQQDPETKEYLVTLEQKPEKGERGFGFTLKGGYEKGEPVIVDSIVPGSTAHKSGICVDDELLELDGMDLSKAYLAMINATMSQAAKAGCVDLKLRRIGKKPIDEYAKSIPDQFNKEISEPSFDQKRLQFEKASSQEYKSVPVKQPLRRQADPISSSSHSQLVNSPPPVNRCDYDTSCIGQLVARYAGAEDSHLRSASQENDAVGIRGLERYRDTHSNTADNLQSRMSPYSEKCRNPGKLADFVPEAERNLLSIKSSNFAANSPCSDYRVTSLHTKTTPGNILNFVPENERSTVRGYNSDSVTKKRDILEDREEIDQRWQRERARVLGLNGEDKRQYTNPEPAWNFGLNKIGLSESTARSISPPRTAPPPPPALKDAPINSYAFCRINQSASNVPPASNRLSNQATSENSQSFDHSQRVFAPFPTSRDINESSSFGLGTRKPEPPERLLQRAKLDGINALKAFDTESASRKLDDLLRKQQRQTTEVELQYLEMAATAAASGVDISNLRDGVNNETRSSSSRDVNQHWLVREAEDLRLTDQLRQYERVDSEPKQQPTRRHSSSIAPSVPIGEHSGANSKHSIGLSANRGPASLTSTFSKMPACESPASHQTMTVSATQRCAYCDKELGRGAAMIIESLNLFFHLACFKCHVCGAALSDGAHGADVRVRRQKLHCQRCYSNDETGLQFSEV